jgi:hypothetical protein
MADHSVRCDQIVFLDAQIENTDIVSQQILEPFGFSAKV